MFLVEAQLKRGIRPQRVQELRKRWVSEGKERKLKQLCSSATRFSLVGSSPPRILWFLKTNKRSAPNLLKNHFSSIWKLKVSRVKSQTISGMLRR